MQAVNKLLMMILALPLALTAYGQRVSILGDSYSTFQGYIPPCNATWYSNPLDTARTDVARVDQTWLWQVIEQAGFTLEVNDSYSGSTVSFYGYNEPNPLPPGTLVPFWRI